MKTSTELKKKVGYEFFKDLQDLLLTGEEVHLFMPRYNGKVKLVLRSYKKMSAKQMANSKIDTNKLFEGKVEIVWEGYAPGGKEIKFSVIPCFEFNRKIRKMTKEQIQKLEDRRS